MSLVWAPSPSFWVRPERREGAQGMDGWIYDTLCDFFRLSSMDIYHFFCDSPQIGGFLLGTWFFVEGFEISWETLWDCLCCFTLHFYVLCILYQVRRGLIWGPSTIL